MNLRDATLIELLDHYAAKSPEAPFLQWMDGPPEGFAQVHETTRRIAAGLRNAGVAKGDTVLIMLPNGLDIIHTWFACNAVGALEVPVNVFLRGDFLEHVIRDSLAEIMVIDGSYIELLHEVDLPERLRRIYVVGDSTGTTVPGVELRSFDDLLECAPIDSLEPAEFADLTGVFYTSGTTGPAKGIMFTYGQGALTARNYIDATGAQAADVFYCCMPLFHSNAQILQVVAPLMLGSRVSIWPQFSATGWLDQIRTVGATITNMLGVMTEFVFGQEPSDQDMDNPLRIVQTIPAPAGIVEAFEQRFGVSCIDGYGLTDVGMVAFRHYDQPLVPGSSGFPVADFDLIIADPATDVPVPIGEIGEILLRPRVPGGFMRGYWQRPEQTIEAWRNLWFHTGDCARLDAEGRVYFQDRMGDSIRVRGENVSSAEIESVIADHPGVQQCAAVAVASQVGDYDIFLLVVPAPGTAPDPAGLIDHCEGRMPYFAVPRYIEFVPELPMTATQKVKKHELRSRGTGPHTWDRIAERIVVTR